MRRKTRSRRWRYFFLLLIVLAYISLIFWLSFIQADALKEIYQRTGILKDTWLHIGAFFVLAFLLHLLLYCFRLRFALIGAVTISFILSVAGEFIQSFVVSRHATLFDFSLHSIGIAGYAAIASVLIIMFRYFTRKKMGRILID